MERWGYLSFRWLSPTTRLQEFFYARVQNDKKNIYIYTELRSQPPTLELNVYATLREITEVIFGIPTVHDQLVS